MERSLTEDQMVACMRRHYEAKQEHLSEIKLQVQIVQASIQKGRTDVNTSNKENGSIGMLGPDQRDKFTHLGHQLSQLSANLTALVTDENQEQRHLNHIKLLHKHKQESRERVNNADVGTNIEELESRHASVCMQKEEIENCINKAIRQLSKMQNRVAMETPSKVDKNDFESCTGTIVKRDKRALFTLQQRN